MSPGYASPWAGPGIPLKAIKWLLMQHGPLVVRPAFDPCDVGVAAQDAAQLHVGALCDQQGAHGADRRIQPRLPARVAGQSTGIAYDERSQGTLQLFRTEKQLDGTGGDVEVLKQFGVPFEVLDPAGCIAAEPALARRARKSSSAACGCPATRPATARCSPSGWRACCMERGVTFRFGIDDRAACRRGRPRSSGVDDQRRAG